MASVKSCRDCKERTVGCHSTCEKYINAVKEYNVIKEVILNEKEKQLNIEGCMAYLRNNRKRGK